MLLDAAAAKALFVIVLSSTQGKETVDRQLPLHVVDRGESWLVTGTPYRRRYAQYCMCHVFFTKRLAEIIGINCHARMIPAEEQTRQWAKIMTPDQYASVFRPATHFEPDGIRDIWYAAYHGVVATPAAASEYAAVLMRTSATWAGVTSSDLIASERDGVWHISGRHEDSNDLITISKKTGKLLSGKL